MNANGEQQHKITKKFLDSVHNDVIGSKDVGNWCGAAYSHNH